MAINIQGLEQKIGGLREEESKYQEKLDRSSTAFGGQTKPTGFDISNQQSLERLQGEIQGLTNEKLKAQWGLSGNAVEESTAKPGFFMKGLDLMTRPLYGIAGAAKHVVGQGKGSLTQDINKNMATDKNLFGDILRTAGVPNAVSMPLGFALDVAFDPVNWLTVGVGAMIPRLAVGAQRGFSGGKGILKGISIAGKSSALEKASTIGRFLPRFKNTESFQKLGEGALRATDAWESLYGKTAMDIVMERGVGGYGYGLSHIFNKAADQIPGGQEFLKKFIYDPIEWVRLAKIKDVIQERLGVESEGVNKAFNIIRRGGDSISSELAEAKAKFIIKEATTPIATVDFTKSVENAALKLDVDRAMVSLQKIDPDGNFARASEKVSEEIQAADEILKNPNPYSSLDGEENVKRLLEDVKKQVGGGITIEDLSMASESMAMDATGVEWFDKMMVGIRDFTIKIGKNEKDIIKVGEKTMGAYERAMAIFRVAKVAASPTAWTNAVVGNMIMNHMATGSISPRFLRRLNQTAKLYLGRPGSSARFDRFFLEDGLYRYYAENPTAFRQMFGNLSFISNPDKNIIGASHYFEGEVLRVGKDAGFFPNSMTIDTLSPDVRQALTEVMTAMNDRTRGILNWTKKTLDEVVAKGEILAREASKTSGGGTAFTRKNLGAGATESGTGMLGAELFKDKVAREMFDLVATNARKNPKNVGWQALDFIFNKMPSGYESIDQTYKMASFITSTKDGYTLNELRRISKLIDINPEDLEKYVPRDLKTGKLLTGPEGGGYLYKLSPKSALELSNVMYLNYSAMPAAIRVLRNFPLLGSPFASFMYGMTLKTGQTLAYNPSAFNKVSFAMQEFGGPKTALEKESLANNKYYSYLNQEGMMRLPFFKKNPVYVNMANMIPYYSLNAFNPSQVRYSGGTAMEAFAQGFQSSPFMKDPVGSALFDFIIQPLILAEGITPRGQFGQPLYPIDANIGEKSLYGARTLAEAFVPNIAAYAGIVTPEKYAQLAPLYRWRKLALAKAQKSQLGITSLEPAMSQVTRAGLGISGIPIQSSVKTEFNRK